MCSDENKFSFSLHSHAWAGWLGKLSEVSTDFKVPENLSEKNVHKYKINWKTSSMIIVLLYMHITE